MDDRRLPRAVKNVLPAPIGADVEREGPGGRRQPVALLVTAWRPVQAAVDSDHKALEDSNVDRAVARHRHDDGGWSVPDQFPRQVDLGVEGNRPLAKGSPRAPP